MKEELKKKESESKEHYIWRVYSSRVENNLTNKEVAEIINEELGTSCQESYFRGIAKHFEIGYSEALESVKNNNEFEELENKIEEIKKERFKLQATKLEYNRNLRKDSRFELFYDNIKDAKDRLPLPKFNELQTNDDNGEHVLSLADIHYGASFKSENNTYNREEVKRRLEVLLSNTKRLIYKNNIKTITVLELADTIQGMLRISDTTLNDIPVVECVVEISRLLATFLNELSKYVLVKYRHILSGNHGQNRYLNTKANEMPSEDMEKIIGNYIKDLVSNNDRIEVTLSKGDYDSFELCGQNILALHGWQVKNIENSIKDYSLLHRKFYDICFLAHFHAGKTISVGECNGDTKVVVCSGFIGSDPYSDKLKKGTKGKCELFKIEENKGITETYTIILN